MTPLSHVLEVLCQAGASVAKLSSSPLGGVIGIATPVGALGQAVKDRFQGKVRTRPFPPTGTAEVDAEREPLRIRIVRLWYWLVAVGLVDVVLICWLFVFQEIPKEGTTLKPTAAQSAVLIVLLLATIASIVCSIFQWMATSRLDKLGAT